jgi:hypothetical protein
MPFAKSVIPAVEPNSRFFELRDRWMQRQDRKGCAYQTHPGFGENRLGSPLAQNSISASRNAAFSKYHLIAVAADADIGKASRNRGASRAMSSRPTSAEMFLTLRRLT